MKEKSIEQVFVEGSDHRCTTDIADISKPLVVRGVTSKSEINECKKIGRDFYYIDTGYLGNFPSPTNTGGKKVWHRVVKNENQLTKIYEAPEDRWKQLLDKNPILAWNGWKNVNKKILLVMPNPKACRYYNVDYDHWEKETIKTIKENTDLPIEVRIKGSRSERNHGYTIYDAFNSGVAATVSLNSIASLESVLFGIPAFVSVPCAASPLASTNLKDISLPFYPNEETIRKHCNSLAYGQFTLNEIASGLAWSVTEKL